VEFGAYSCFEFALQNVPKILVEFLSATTFDASFDSIKAVKDGVPLEENGCPTKLRCFTMSNEKKNLVV